MNSTPSRRTVVAGAAWAAPAIVVASAAPAMAASGGTTPTTTVTSTSVDYSTGAGSFRLLLVPAPTEQPVLTYEWAGQPHAGQLVDLGASGEGRLYEIALTYPALTPPASSTDTFSVTPAGYPTATVTVERTPAGQLDSSYPAGGPHTFNATVFGLMPLPGDGLLVGGRFTTVDGQATNYFARFDADGTLDTSYSATRQFRSTTPRGFARQADGRVIAVGNFFTYDNVPAVRLARLEADGTRDTEFNQAVGGGADNPLFSVAVLPDQRIVVGGLMTSFDGVPANGVARLLASGQVDPTFSAPATPANQSVYGLAPYPGDRLVVASSYTDAARPGTP